VRTSPSAIKKISDLSAARRAAASNGKIIKLTFNLGHEELATTEVSRVLEAIRKSKD
jgi:hypothetical protein